MCCCRGKESYSGNEWRIARRRMIFAKRKIELTFIFGEKFSNRPSIAKRGGYINFRRSISNVTGVAP